MNFKGKIKMEVVYEGQTLRKTNRDLLVTPFDDAWHPEKSPDYIEWWYFDSVNEDRSLVRGRFYIMGDLSKPKGVKAGVKFSVLNPDGRETIMEETFPYASFSSSMETCDVRIGKNYAKGRLLRYQLHVEQREKALDLEFTSRIRGVKPAPEGKVYFDKGKGYMAWVVPQPRTEVKGTFRTKEATLNLRGEGYHDHNWSNIPLIDYLSHWLWGRMHDKDFTIVFADVVAAKRFGGIHIKPLMIYDRKKLLYMTSEPEKWELKRGNIKIDPATGIRHPDTYMLETQDKDISLKLGFSAGKICERVDLLEGFDPLRRWFIRTFKANPGMLSFLSIGQGELTLKGRKKALAGAMLHEFFDLRK